MTRRRRRLGLALPTSLTVCALLAPATARADDLTLTTRELGGWNDALASLRADLGSEGRTVHLAVRSRGEPVACESYRLELDAAARSAFRVGACDPETAETALVLDHRAALFDEGSHVPRPRTLSLTAMMTLRETAAGGPEGGSVVHCSWAVQPYLDDVEHGTRVMLTPDHYALRSGSAWVSASPEGTGWSLRATGTAEFHLAYEVVEKATGEVVLRQNTTLTCGVAEAPEAPPRPAEPSPSVVLQGVAPFTPREPAALPRFDLQAPCRWGAGPRGCNQDPKRIVAIVLGVVAALPLSVATAWFIAAGVEKDPVQRGVDERVGLIVGVQTLIPAALFAVFVHSLHPAKPPPVGVGIVPLARGAGWGLTGTF